MSNGINGCTEEIERVSKNGGNGTASFVRKQSKKVAEYIATFSKQLKAHNSTISSYWSKIEKNTLGLLENNIAAKPENKDSLINYMVILNDKNVSDDCLYIVNGIVILETVEKIPDLCVNGLLLKRKKSRYEMTRMNGRSVEVEDNVVIKPYPNTIEIDSDMVRSFDYNTLVAAGNNVDIDDDVTEQMLFDKKITFAAGNEVKCGKNILGYVKVNSTVGNKITEKNE